jgi:hypothetical protein
MREVIIPGLLEGASQSKLLWIFDRSTCSKVKKVLGIITVGDEAV